MRTTLYIFILVIVIPKLSAYGFKEENYELNEDNSDVNYCKLEFVTSNNYHRKYCKRIRKCCAF